MNKQTNNNRAATIKLCAEALKTLERNPQARKVSRTHFVSIELYPHEVAAIEALVSVEGWSTYSDIEGRFVAAVQARCTKLVAHEVTCAIAGLMEERCERRDS